MTLKEKFLELAFAKISSEELRDECVKIADDYAIDFSAWLFTRTDINLKNKNLNELLEIFKKEKGL